MNTQDLTKLHSSGHGSYAGVHLCHKCGWPFPKPHPSAKHRRAHKKVCGTIEGYKLTDLSILDDEHPSDDDQKTPSPKVTKKSFSRSVSGGVLERSDKSGDDVFSDAATEFSDAGASSGVDEILNDSPLVYTTGDDKSPAQSIDGAAARDIIQSENETTHSNHMQNTESSSISIQLGSTTQSKDHKQSKLPDSEAEESATVDKNSPSHDLNVLKLDTSPDPHELDKKTIVQDLPEWASASVAVEIDEKGDAEQFGTPAERGRTASEEKIGVEDTNRYGPVPIATETDRCTPVPQTVKITQLKEEYSTGSAAESFLTDPSPEVGSLTDRLSAQVDNSQAKEKTSQELMVKGDNVGLEPEILQDDLSSKVESAAEMDTNVDTSQANVIDGGNNSEDVYVLSIPSDIRVVDQPEIMLEGFKGHKDLKLNEIDSCIQMKDSDVLGSFSEENDAGPLNQSVKGIYQEVGNSKLAIEEMPIDQVDESCTNMGKAYDSLLLDEQVGDPTDAVGTHVENSGTLSPQELQEVSDDLSRNNIKENAVLVLPNVNSLVSSMGPEVHDIVNSVNSNDAGGLDKAEIFDVGGDDSRKEFGKNPHGPLTSGITNLDGSDATHDTSDIARYENESSMEGNLALSEKATPELVGSISKFHASKSGIENSFGNLVQHDSAHNSETIREVNLVAETPANMKSHEEDSLGDLESDIKGRSKIQVEHFATVDIVGDVKHGDVEDPTSVDSASLREESHGNLSKRQPVISGVDVSVDKSGQNDNVDGICRSMTDAMMLSTRSDAPEDDKTFTPPKDLLEDSEGKNNRELGRDPSDVASASLQEEIDDDLSKPFSTLDASVDTSSQNDSVDGNWGSVSDTTMFSTLSDAPEDQKTSVKTKNTLEGSDKSETFEPPSFMTLVEPKDQRNTAVASETGEAENLHQSDPSSQAGWFPSLTHVANDTKGRKKNKEIIAKVANWSTVKQHNNLKNLLGEASLETKIKSPNAKENLVPVSQGDEVPSKYGGSVTTVNSILGHREPKTEASATEATRAWNSPARYPAEIKSEKKKIKGRPHWVPFMCCSSVN